MTGEDREDMRNEIQRYLKNNLRLNVETKQSYTGNADRLYATYFKVTLELDGETISEINIDT